MSIPTDAAGNPAVVDGPWSTHAVACDGIGAAPPGTALDGFDHVAWLIVDSLGAEIAEHLRQDGFRLGMDGSTVDARGPTEGVRQRRRVVLQKFRIGAGE